MKPLVFPVAEVLESKALKDQNQLVLPLVLTQSVQHLICTTNFLSGWSRKTSKLFIDLQHSKSKPSTNSGCETCCSSPSASQESRTHEKDNSFKLNPQGAQNHKRGNRNIVLRELEKPQRAFIELRGGFPCTPCIEEPEVQFPETTNSNHEFEVG